MKINEVRIGNYLLSLMNNEPQIIFVDGIEFVNEQWWINI